MLGGIALSASSWISRWLARLPVRHPPGVDWRWGRVVILEENKGSRYSSKRTMILSERTLF